MKWFDFTLLEQIPLDLVVIYRRVFGNGRIRAEGHRGDAPGGRPNEKDWLVFSRRNKVMLFTPENNN